MYSSLLVEIRLMLESCGLNHVAPNCLHARYIPGFESTIVLDNLYYQGYNPLSNIDKVFTYKEISTILQNLATMHGAALLVKQNLVTDLSRSYSFLLDPSLYLQWKLLLINKQAKKYPGIVKFLQKSNLQSSEVRENIRKILSANKLYSTIILGDLELENILQREDHCVFVDWTSTMAGNPALDVSILILLLHAGDAISWRKNSLKLYELFWCYLEKFVNTHGKLSKLISGCKEEFLEDCQASEILAFTVLLGREDSDEDDISRLISLYLNEI